VALDRGADVRHDLPAGTLGPLAERIRLREQAKREAEVAEAELAAYLQGICLAMGWPFPPTAMDPDEGWAEWPDPE